MLRSHFALMPLYTLFSVKKYKSAQKMKKTQKTNKTRETAAYSKTVTFQLEQCEVPPAKTTVDSPIHRIRFFRLTMLLNVTKCNKSMYIAFVNRLSGFVHRYAYVHRFRWRNTNSVYSEVWNTTIQPQRMCVMYIQQYEGVAVIFVSSSNAHIAPSRITHEISSSCE